MFSAARGMPLAQRLPQLPQRLLERVGPADAVLERFGAPRGFRRQLPDVLRRLFPCSELRRSRGARGMLALNACRRAQLGFAPARFAGARWGPRTTDTANGPLTRLLPAPSSPPPLCSGVCHAACFPTPSSKSFWGGGCSTRGKGLCRFRLSSLPVGLVLQVFH